MKRALKRGRVVGEKKAQIDLSFGMIFTIIIIIVTVAVAFYVIRAFIVVDKCQQIGSFYKDLQGEVTNAFNSQYFNNSYTGTLSRGITYVCFGNMSQSALTAYQTKRNELQGLNRPANHNVYVYPPSEACDLRFVSTKMKFITVDKFFCVQVVNGKIHINLFKDADIGQFYIKISK